MSEVSCPACGARFAMQTPPEARVAALAARLNVPARVGGQVAWTVPSPLRRHYGRIVDADDTVLLIKTLTALVWLRPGRLTFYR